MDNDYNAGDLRKCDIKYHCGVREYVKNVKVLSYCGGKGEKDTCARLRVPKPKTCSMLCVCLEGKRKLTILKCLINIKLI